MTQGRAVEVNSFMKKIVFCVLIILQMLYVSTSFAKKKSDLYLVNVISKLNLRDPNNMTKILDTLKRGEKVSLDKSQSCPDFESMKMVFIASKKAKGCVAYDYLAQSLSNFETPKFIKVEAFDKKAFVPLFFNHDDIKICSILKNSKEEKLCRQLMDKKGAEFSDIIDYIAKKDFSYSYIAKYSGEKTYKYQYHLDLKTGALTNLDFKKTKFKVATQYLAYWHTGVPIGFYLNKSLSKEAYVLLSNTKIDFNAFKVKSWAVSSEEETTYENFQKLYPERAPKPRKNQSNFSKVQFKSKKWQSFMLFYYKYKYEITNGGLAGLKPFKADEESFVLYDLNLKKKLASRHDSTPIEADCASDQSPFYIKVSFFYVPNTALKLIFLENEMPYDCDKIFIEKNLKLEELTPSCITEVPG